jgi:hypothetical protein
MVREPVTSLEEMVGFDRKQVGNTVWPGFEPFDSLLWSTRTYGVDGNWPMIRNSHTVSVRIVLGLSRAKD